MRISRRSLYGAAVRRYLRAALAATRALLALDPRAVEALLSIISLAMAGALVFSPSPNKPQPVWAWTSIAFVASACKFWGVTLEVAGWARPAITSRLRGVGNFAGFVFWGVLALVFFLLAPQSLTWGILFPVSAAQAWALYRIARRH